CLDNLASGTGILALSARYAAGGRVGGGDGPPVCPRCAFRCAAAGPIRPPAPEDCAAHHAPAPLTGKYREYAAPLRAAALARGRKRPAWAKTPPVFCLPRCQPPAGYAARHYRR